MSAIASTLPLPAARAGFWRRLGAAIVDGIILGIVNAILAFAIGKAAYGVDWVVSAAYFTYCHGARGQTPGDAALGVRVVDGRSGTAAPIGYARAFGRWFVSIFSAIAIFIGYLWMLWDPQKQTWHDKAVGSLVVPVDEL